MRDVSAKHHTLRSARAAASVHVAASTIRAVRAGNVPKADPLGVAKIAGIQAAKQTSLIIPYCHQVPLDYVSVHITTKPTRIEILTEVKAIWKTGVEMEALFAASAAALTLYDMLKIIDDTMEIGPVTLLEKKGGRSSMNTSGKGITAAVLVMSDSLSGGKKKDISGKNLTARLEEYGVTVKVYKILPDDRLVIERALSYLADIRHIDLIMTTGGTGLSPRDVTPEATMAAIDRRMEGVEEALRSFGQDRVPTAMLSRGVAGVRGKTIIINLPGSPAGVKDGMNALFPALLHSFSTMEGKGHGKLDYVPEVS